MDTFSQNIEYQNALNFLQTGCDCGCSTKLPHERFAQLRSNFQSLSKIEQDASVMTQLTFMSGGTKTTSPRLKNKERTNQRVFYQWDHKTSLCQKTYLNMLGIGKKYLKNIKKHLASKGLTTRIHSNIGRKPQWKTKLLIDEKVKQTVKNFLEDYANSWGSPSPIGKTKRTTEPVIELPTDMSYASVHRDFLTSLEEGNSLKRLKYHTFYKLWKQLVPHIQFANPRTDLCDTCHQLKGEIYSCSNPVRKEELKKICSAINFNINEKENIIMKILD